MRKKSRLKKIRAGEKGGVSKKGGEKMREGLSERGKGSRESGNRGQGSVREKGWENKGEMGEWKGRGQGRVGKQGKGVWERRGQERVKGWEYETGWVSMREKGYRKRKKGWDRRYEIVREKRWQTSRENEVREKGVRDSEQKKRWEREREWEIAKKQVREKGQETVRENEVREKRQEIRGEREGSEQEVG